MKAPKFIHFRVLLTSAVVRLSFFGFILTGLFLLLTPASWYPEGFTPRVIGFSNLAAALVLLLPDMFLSAEFSDDTVREVQEKYQALIGFLRFACIALILNFIGLIGFFNTNLGYDKVLHFSNQLLLMLALPPVLIHWLGRPEHRAIWTAVIIMACAIVLWELYEYASDRLLGTRMFGQPGQSPGVDTIIDLAAGAAGIAAGAIGQWTVRRPSAQGRSEAGSRRL